ncbi:ethylbenzene dehydrogenase-related protein [Phaeovulum sp. W22_SRMD_FR3]|uniref:ethylbenzene dehydrogenase-related protein n=1 Tax=Phaeovulum sp. W22_SRMD_FR3 TaxID=3240274 RepID=UPI003F9A6D26
MSVLRTHPLSSALMGSVVALGALLAVNWYLCPHLIVPAISAVDAPKLDGDISDAAWSAAVPVTVLTRHGGDFGGSGESKITVRAVHDSQNIYLALDWEDPTRSLEYLPLFKNGGAWRSVQTDNQSASEPYFFDDRIAVMLAEPGLPLIGGAIHLGKKPLPEAPGSTTGRGLHYTDPGKMVDLWIWHAALGAQTARVEDAYLGPPLPFTAAQMAGKTRYFGGISEDDPTHPLTQVNFIPAPGAQDGAVQPLNLPRYKTAAVDDIKSDAGLSDPLDHEKLWALQASAAVPYSAQADAALADGSVIPGVMVDDAGPVGPHDTLARGAWSGGHWILEIKRSLAPGDKDLAFKDGIMLWFAAFDHSQSRHSYHLRPLIVEMP